VSATIMRHRARKATLVSAAILSLLGPVAAAADAPTGLQRDMVFAAYTPLSGNAERVRRLLSPLTARRMQQQLLREHQVLRGQAVDLAQERFALYVPARVPPQGHALLVFVPPWKEARVPQEWIPALLRSGTIFVSAAQSGNDADVFNRREPLAVLAAWNAMQRYRIDPAHVYVGGFSGGSRVALRVALAYPDLFRGALLEAGSDPIGSAEVPLPPVELVHRFQQDSRLVFLTGEGDTFHLAQDARSRDSLKTWCVFDTDVQPLPRTSHDVPDGAAFARALNALDQPKPPDPDRLAACRQHNQQAMSAQLHEARALIDRHLADDARKLLEKIDAQYGGLASPQSMDLMQRIEPEP